MKTYVDRCKGHIQAGKKTKLVYLMARMILVKLPLFKTFIGKIANYLDLF
ncbi:hypothetical protein KAR34_03730 [bacterium]|nr:hypothetical protein [bacterium]